MGELKFALIGDGQVARYHRKAIEHIGGELNEKHIVDPKYRNVPIIPIKRTTNTLYARDGCVYKDYESLVVAKGELISSRHGHARMRGRDKSRFDYIVICSPSYFHRQQIQVLLNLHPDIKIICEKPAFLPWEQIIDSDKVNIVLQLLYIKDMPKKADLIKTVFVRDEEYFKTWKGDARKTGGVFFNLFIHYISLAINLGADFEGIVLSKGKQEHTIWENEKCIFDIGAISMQDAYNNMYESILNGNGIKPKDIFYLNWTLQRNSEIFGYGKNSINRPIEIGRELL